MLCLSLLHTPRANAGTPKSLVITGYENWKYSGWKAPIAMFMKNVVNVKIDCLIRLLDLLTQSYSYSIILI